MMDKLAVFLLLGAFVLSAAQNSETLKCVRAIPDVPKEWIDVVEPCDQAMRQQVQEEIRAAIQYLAMAAHFSRDTINRPGFAELFFKAAGEERQHGMKLIEYLAMRGSLTENVGQLLKRHVVPPTTSWINANEALKQALVLEASVTKKIRNVIAVCENSNNFNDYQLVDYLTSDFLPEQYHGQRELAGHVSTLGKMIEKHGALGEFLFDKQLLR